MSDPKRYRWEMRGDMHCLVQLGYIPAAVSVCFGTNNSAIVLVRTVDGTYHKDEFGWPDDKDLRNRALVVALRTGVCTVDKDAEIVE